jgi:nitronate monooxygenase
VKSDQREKNMNAHPRSITDLFGIELPIIQAPMLGVVTASMVIGVAEAGGLGSLPLTNLSPQAARMMFSQIRQRTSKPVNVNFLCHESPERNPASEDAWARSLMPYYAELGLASDQSPFGILVPTFGTAYCDLLDEIGPEVVSFHFGLPPEDLLERVRKTGAKIVSSATTVEEAKWLEEAGCDAIIAQGLEAGGHRGAFLHDQVDAQVGTMALVPQIVDAVKVPVIAAGGIGDQRGGCRCIRTGSVGSTGRYGVSLL